MICRSSCTFLAGLVLPLAVAAQPQQTLLPVDRPPSPTLTTSGPAVSWEFRAAGRGEEETLVLRTGSVSATCASLTFRGEGGQVTVTPGDGSVHLEGAGLEASADRVTRTGANGATLELTGKARLKWDGQGRHAEGAGDRIVVDLAARRVEINLTAEAADQLGGDDAVENPVFAPVPPSSYCRLFERVLAVLNDCQFEIAYSDRYDGRIETFPRKVPGAGTRPSAGTSSRAERGSADRAGIRQRGVLSVRAAESGGFFIDVKVFNEQEDLPKPAPGAHGGAASDAPSSQIPVGRDTTVERAIRERIKKSL
jgi:hypothetical protein